MTIGTKTTNLTSQFMTYTHSTTPAGYNNVTNDGFHPVGFYWTKSWNGTDYPPAAPGSVFMNYWVKVDRTVDQNVSSPRPKYTYLQRWLARRMRPRRAYMVDHPFSATITMWSDQAYKTRWTDGWMTSIAERTFKQSYGEGYSLVPSSRWSANDTIALRGKLRERIVGSDFDLSVFLGESPEALRLISDSAIRIRKAYSAVRRADLVSAAEALGAKPRKSFYPNKRASQPGKEGSYANSVSQRWLELQYGWLPLLKDVHGGAHALAQQLNNPLVQTYRVRMRKPLAVTPNSSVISNGGGWAFRGETRAQLIARVKETSVVEVNGLTDPLSVAWELLPWSFVADWFIPVGNYLAARSLARALTGTFVETTTEVQYFTCGALKMGGYFTVLKQPNWRYFTVNVNRTVNTTLSVPRPQFKTLSEVPSWKRAANAVALLITNFGSGKR